MRRVLLLLLIPLSFTNLTAQDTLTAGDKVRVTMDNRARGVGGCRVGDRQCLNRAKLQQGKIVGYLTAIEGDRLTLDSSLVLPLASLTKLEVSQGMKSHGERGVWLGLLFGLGGAIAVCAATFEDTGTFAPEVSCNGSLAAGVFLGSIVLGGIIGVAMKTESWKDVPLDRIRVSLTPRGGGLEVSAKFVF